MHSKVHAKMHSKLTAAQQHVLDAITANPQIIHREQTTLLNLADRKVSNSVSKLKELGIIRRVGLDKTGYIIYGR